MAWSRHYFGSKGKVTTSLLSIEVFFQSLIQAYLEKGNGKLHVQPA